MKHSKFLVIVCLLLCLTCLVACSRDPDGTIITTGRKPFAAPDPSNPYDEKLDHGYFDDLTRLSDDPNDCFVVNLTHTESLNNLFHDYVPKDFHEMRDFDLKQIRDLSGIEKMRSLVSKTDKTDYELKKVSNYSRTLIFEFNFESHEILAQAAKVLYKHIAVKEIVPNGGSCGWFEEPNDPKYQTNQQNFADLINLEEAWDHTTGSSSVKIGVLDSGILDSVQNIISKPLLVADVHSANEGKRQIGGIL